MAVLADLTAELRAAGINVFGYEELPALDFADGEPAPWFVTFRPSEQAPLDYWGGYKERLSVMLLASPDARLADLMAWRHALDAALEASPLVLVENISGFAFQGIGERAFAAATFGVLEL